MGTEDIKVIRKKEGKYVYVFMSRQQLTKMLRLSKKEGSKGVNVEIRIPNEVFAYDSFGERKMVRLHEDKEMVKNVD